MENNFWSQIPYWHNYVFYNWIDKKWQSSVNKPTRRGQANDAYWWDGGLELPNELGEKIVNQKQLSKINLSDIELILIFKREF